VRQENRQEQEELPVTSILSSQLNFCFAAGDSSARRRKGGKSTRSGNLKFNFPADQNFQRSNNPEAETEQTDAQPLRSLQLKNTSQIRLRRSKRKKSAPNRLAY
jgi:hypothetical protein